MSWGRDSCVNWQHIWSTGRPVINRRFYLVVIVQVVWLDYTITRGWSRILARHALNCLLASFSIIIDCTSSFDCDIWKEMRFWTVELTFCVVIFLWYSSFIHYLHSWLHQVCCRVFVDSRVRFIIIYSMSVKHSELSIFKITRLHLHLEIKVVYMFIFWLEGSSFSSQISLSRNMGWSLMSSDSKVIKHLVGRSSCVMRTGSHLGF